MTNKSDFGRALQILRKHRGLTQEDFSEVSSRTYLSSLERGLKSPTLEKIEQLAGVLSVHPAALITLAFSTGRAGSVELTLKRIEKDLFAVEL